MNQPSKKPSVIRTIAAREFYDNLQSFRFAAAFILCLTVMSLAAYLSSDRFIDEWRLYLDAERDLDDKMSQIWVYENIRPVVHKPPSVLSIFSRGLSEQVPNEARVSIDGYKMPPADPNVYYHYSLGEVFNQTSATYGENPLLNVFENFDIILIVQLMIVILALVFGYDAVSGEKESGTLKMVMSSRAGRTQFVLGKTMGGFCGLLICILSGWLVVVLVLLLHPGINPSAGEWAVVAWLSLLVILVTFIYYVLGIFLSVLFRNSALALISGLLVWFLLTVGLPDLAGYLTAQTVDTITPDEISASAEEIETEFEAKVKEVDDRLFKDIYPDGDRHVTVSHVPYVWGYFSMLISEKEAEFQTRKNSQAKNLLIQRGDDLIGLKDRLHSSRRRQRNYVILMAGLSPTFLLRVAASDLCGTGLNDYTHFIEQLKLYRRTIIGYLLDKDAFASNRYFCLGTQEELSSNTETRERLRKELYEDDYWMEYFDPIPDAPRWRFTSSPVGSRLALIWPLALVLLLMAVLILGCSVLSMNRTDVR